MALKGLQVVEMAGLAPAPFCGMILADYGAKIIRIDKKPGTEYVDNFVSHGKKSVSLNLKHPDGIDVFKKIVAASDVLLEPFRTGVMERLGLGPDSLLKLNKKLIYARLTGYGQDGSLSSKAGHDINFLSYSGVLSMMGPSNSSPLPPANLLADFGGGGLTCALGIIMALYERTKTGKGQIVDCSMTRGAAYLASWIIRSSNSPMWGAGRGLNILDGGSHYYNTYRTKDDKWMAVGAIESKFYENLLKGLGFTEEEIPQYSDFHVASKKFADRFEMHTQSHWIEVFKNLDACVSPVLTFDEASMFDHNMSQKVFHKSCDSDILAPSPEPRLSSSGSICNVAVNHPPQVGEHTIEVLKHIGYTSEEIQTLRKNNAIFLQYGNSKL